MLVALAPAAAARDIGVIRSGKDVRFSLTGSTSIDLGAATAGYAMTLSNPDSVDVEDDVVVRFEVFGDDTLSPGDVVVEYESAPGSGIFVALPLESCWSDLCADFGGPGGFPVGANYDVTTALRLTFNVHGTYTVRASPLGVHSLNQYASASLVETVLAPAVAIEMTGPTVIDRGVAVAGFAATFANEGDGAVPEAVLVRYEFIGENALDLASLKSELEAIPGAGDFVELALAPCGSHLCAEAGSPDGFAMPAGNVVSLAMRNTVADIGSYEIKARVVGRDTGIEYAIAVHTFEVISQPAQLVVVTGQGQTAAIGSPVAVAPRIRVEDAMGAPVEGASVSFRIASGGGSVGESSVFSDADGMAGPGSWTLGVEPGSNGLLVQVAGSAANAVLVEAQAIIPAQINVSVSTRSDFVAYGDTQEYVIVVGNDGAVGASAVSLDVPVPVEFALDSVSWTCTPIGDADCLESGVGPIAETLSLGAGAQAVFVISARVGDSQSDRITLTAMVDSPLDVSPADNSASSLTQIVLTRGTFETGTSTTSQEAGSSVVHRALDGQGSLVLDLGPPGAGPLQTRAEGITDRGARFAVDIVVAGATRVLLITTGSRDAPTLWSAVPLPATTAHVAIGLLTQGSAQPAGQLIVLGEGVEQQLPLDVAERAEVDHLAQ